MELKKHKLLIHCIDCHNNYPKIEILDAIREEHKEKNECQPNPSHFCDKCHYWGKK